MKSPFVHILLTAALVGCLALSMYDIKYIEGTSMQPTLANRESVIIFRWAYGLQPPFFQRYLVRWSRVRPGQLVFFQDPVFRKPVVKRCIATEYSPILKNGEGVIIGGELLIWSELRTDQLSTLNSIPGGKLFLLGDNRTVSFDSRFYGLVEENRIEGRVVRFRK